MWGQKEEIQKKERGNIERNKEKERENIEKPWWPRIWLFSGHEAGESWYD